MYQIYDHQLCQFAFGGSIFNSKHKAIEQLISFFSVDHNPQDLKCIESDLKNGLDYADFEIMEVE